MDDTTNVTVDNSRITLVPTSHVETDSGTLVDTTISESDPELVSIELCRPRFDSMKQRAETGEVDLLNGESKKTVFKSSLGLLKQPRKLFGLFFLVILFVVQKILKKIKGLKPGDSDMEKAIESSANNDKLVCLIDRNISETIRLFTQNVTLREIVRLFGSGVKSTFKLIYKFVTRKGTNSIADKNKMLNQMDAWQKKYPSMFNTFITERDEIMASRLYWLSKKRIALEQDDEDEDSRLTSEDEYHIVAVIGAGHKNGIENLLNKYDNGEKEPLKTDLTIISPSELEAFKTTD